MLQMYIEEKLSIKYGADNAIMIDYLCNWLKENIEKNNCNYVCKTLDEIQSSIKLYTYKQVRRILKNLKKLNIIEMGKCRTTRTYTIIDKETIELYGIVLHNDDNDNLGNSNNCHKCNLKNNKTITQTSAQNDIDNSCSILGNIALKQMLPNTSHESYDIYNNNIYNKSYIMNHENAIHKWAKQKNTKHEKYDNNFVEQIMKTFKTKYNAELIKGCVIKLLLRKGKDVLLHYVEHFQRHLDSVGYTILNIGKFFYSTVMKSYPTPPEPVSYTPKDKQQNSFVQNSQSYKPPQMCNYEQRKYDDSFFDSICDNLQYVK